MNGDEGGDGGKTEDGGGVVKISKEVVFLLLLKRTMK